MDVRQNVIRVGGFKLFKDNMAVTAFVYGSITAPAISDDRATWFHVFLNAHIPHPPAKPKIILQLVKFPKGIIRSHVEDNSTTNKSDKTR